MKIAVVSYGHVDPVLPLFKNIKNSASCDLIIVFSQRQKHESILSFDDLKVKDGFLKKETTINILKRIGLSDQYPYIKLFVYHNNRTRSPKNIWLSLKLIKQLKNYDIVHFNGQHTTLIHLLVLLPKRIKRIFTVHDYQPHTGEGGKYKLFACSWNNLFVIKKKWPVVLQNKNDFMLAAAENPQAVNRLFYIPFGVFVNYLYWSDPDMIELKYDLLFFGRISEYKGLGYLLQAVIILQKIMPEISLCIVGAGDISLYSKLLKETNNCTLINKYVSSEHLVSVLQRSKIVVCPYTDATQSGVVMTAFALNKPVIASDIRSFSEVITDGKTGLLFKTRDVDDLKSKMLYLLDHDSLRVEMARNITDFKELPDYNWDGIAKKYLKLYETIFHNENSNSY